jgi:hypothetical protein
MKHKTALDRIFQAKEISARHLDLAGLDLEQLPCEIGILEKLECLDLSHNRLAALPLELSGLKSLKKLFLTRNEFDTFPEIVRSLHSLELFSIKSNRIESLGEINNIPSSVNWLILTDNRIQNLPSDFGIHLAGLRKLAMSGNCLRKLPSSFSSLLELELVRLSNNLLEHFPEEILSLPCLSWLALGGNPCIDSLPYRNEAVKNLDSLKLQFGDYCLGNILGAGASGTVYLSSDFLHPEKKHAVKMFKALSSDGLPEDELAVCTAVVFGSDIPDGLIPVSGWFDRPNLGLVMEYIENADSLAGVPSLDSITRDIYRNDSVYTAEDAVAILLNSARALKYIHSRHVCHGDFYAHNIIIPREGSPRLGDWGASFFYPDEFPEIERIEVRSFGILVEELNLRIEGGQYSELTELAHLCMSADLLSRPSFSEIIDRLELFNP